MILGRLKFLVAEGLLRLLGQGRPQLVVAQTAAVLRDQGQQGIGEVGAGGHRGRTLKACFGESVLRRRSLALPFGSAHCGAESAILVEASCEQPETTVPRR